MNVFDLFATLSLDTSSYDEGLDKSEQKGSNFGKNLGTVVATGAKVGAAAIAATGAAVVGLSTSFANGIKNTAAMGDEIQKQSQKLGLAYSKYQEFDYVLNIAGTSMANMSVGMKSMTNKLDEAKNGSEGALAMFEALGMSFEDLQNMTREEVFEQAIYGFQNLEESTERAALANDLFGRSGQELTPLFNMTNEQTKELIKTANEYGMVMSDEAVDASADFQDSLTTLNGTLTGFKNNMLSQFLPSITTVINGISSIFAGDKSGLNAIKKGIKDFGEKLKDVLPTFIELGSEIVSSLALAIIENAPDLLESGLNAMNTLVDAFIDNADMIIGAVVKIVDVFVSKIIDPERAAKFTQAAIDIIVKLADGLTEALPALLPAIVSVVVAIVTTLTEPDNLSLLINCSLQLVMALANGIVDALPELVAVIPTVIFNLTESIIDNFPQILNTTIYLIGALGYAILQALGSLLGQTLWELTEGFSNMFKKASDFGTKIGNWLRDKIQSGKNAVQNFFSSIGNFFTNGFNNIRNKVQTNLDNIKNKFTSIFDNVKNVVHNAIEYIKGLFNFQWSLPKIKLPHFKISGQLDLFATPPQIPSVSVEWYKKAMNQPYLLNDATIFGAANGKLLGAGESGSELVIGTDKLMSMMKQAVGGSRPITINVYGAQGQDVRLLAKAVSRELQNAINDKNKVYA